MTIERSHQKARPTLPRSSDLRPVQTDRAPDGSRSAGGRFAAGNTIARGRGWKRALVKMLGRNVDDPIASAVAADAWRLYCATVRELPNDGPTVRGLVALQARHQALAAFWAAQTVAEGLATPEGIAAADQATKHGQRAERLVVTALDIATRLAAADRAKPADAHRALVDALTPATPQPAPQPGDVSEPTPTDIPLPESVCVGSPEQGRPIP